MNRPDTENNSELNGEIGYETQGKLTTYVRYSGSVLPACLAAYFALFPHHQRTQKNSQNQDPSKTGLLQPRLDSLHGVEHPYRQNSATGCERYPHTNHAKHPSEAVDNRRDQDKFRASQH